MGTPLDREVAVSTHFARSYLATSVKHRKICIETYLELSDGFVLLETWLKITLDLGTA